MKPFCHSERSGTKRNVVEESLTVVCVTLQKIKVIPQQRETPLGMTTVRHHIAAL